MYESAAQSGEVNDDQWKKLATFVERAKLDGFLPVNQIEVEVWPGFDLAAFARIPFAKQVRTLEWSAVAEPPKSSSGMKGPLEATKESS